MKEMKEMKQPAITTEDKQFFLGEFLEKNTIHGFQYSFSLGDKAEGRATLDIQVGESFNESFESKQKLVSLFRCTVGLHNWNYSSEQFSNRLIRLVERQG